MSKSLSTGIKAELLSQLEGFTVALATPLDDTGDFDPEAFQRLTNRAIKSGAAGVFALGWMGEQPCLTDRVREAVMNEVVQITAGRVPVIIGVSEQSLSRALGQAALAREAGADIILSTPPYSYPVPQEMVFDFFHSLSSESGLPLIAYHNAEVSVPIAIDTLARLSEDAGMLGVKDYSDFVRVQRLLRQVNRPGQFGVITGDEYLLGPSLLIGIKHSTMGGPGNLVPAWCAKMHQSARAGNWEQLSIQHQRLVEFCEAIYTGADSAYSAVKYALSKLGICGATISRPLPPVSGEHRKRVDQALSRFADMLE